MSGKQFFNFVLGAKYNAKTIFTVLLARELLQSAIKLEFARKEVF